MALKKIAMMMMATLVVCREWLCLAGWLPRMMMMMTTKIMMMMMIMMMVTLVVC